MDVDFDTQSLTSSDPEFNSCDEGQMQQPQQHQEAVVTPALALSLDEWWERQERLAPDTVGKGSQDTHRHDRRHRGEASHSREGEPPVAIRIVIIYIINVFLNDKHILKHIVLGHPHARRLDGDKEAIQQLPCNSRSKSRSSMQASTAMAPRQGIPSSSRDNS